MVQLLALFFENRVVLGSIPAETTPALKHAIFIFALSAHSRQEKDTKNNWICADWSFSEQKSDHSFSVN